MTSKLATQPKTQVRRVWQVVFFSKSSLCVNEELNMNKRRVVVTGMGMITPLWLDVETTWKSILAGKSGISHIEHFDASDLSCRICGYVKDFDVTRYMSDKE